MLRAVVCAQSEAKNVPRPADPRRSAAQGSNSRRSGEAMALSHRLEMRQGQSLVMTPQLLQAIKLLQLSSLDLIAYVEAELERNPLLERAESESEESAAVADGEGPGEDLGREGATADELGDDAGAAGLGEPFGGGELAAGSGSAGEWSGEGPLPD